MLFRFVNNLSSEKYTDSHTEFFCNKGGEATDAEVKMAQI